jgi:hypothetical protein
MSTTEHSLPFRNTGADRHSILEVDPNSGMDQHIFGRDILLYKR